MKEFNIRVNGEWKKARYFNAGDRVQNEYGDKGVVKLTKNSGLFVEVDWDRKEGIGKTWLVTSLTLAK